MEFEFPKIGYGKSIVDYILRWLELLGNRASCSDLLQFKVNWQQIPK